ncbi:MAG TPA: hypothetical protein VGJ74_09855 [Burkholderiales bacterium]|jgi:hypothetical protein
MIARARGKPIRYLANVSRWIWLLIGGGAVLFIAVAVALALANPGTPANQLVSWTNGWLFLPPVAMAGAGVYMSLRWWRCPHCRRPLSTKGALPERCPRCGNALREG